MEQNFQKLSPEEVTPETTNMDEVKEFYKDSFPKIFKAVFTEPITGTYQLFLARSEKTYQHSLLLIATTGILFTLLPYIAVGDARQYMGFKRFVVIGITATLCLFVISFLSFVIKSISGKADFKNELLTGGVCGIPLSLLVAIAFLLSLFSDSFIQNILNPQALLNGSAVIIVCVLYVLLSMINIFQQSLKSSGTNDALAWYVSPVSILLSFYLTGKIIFDLLD